MALTDDQLAAVRSWVGSGPTDEALSARADRLILTLDDPADESTLLTAVVIEELREQVANAVNAPTQIRSAAGTSLSFDRAAIERQLKKLESGGLVSTDPDTNGGSLVTVKRMRRGSARR